MYIYIYYIITSYHYDFPFMVCFPVQNQNAVTENRPSPRSEVMKAISSEDFEQAARYAGKPRYPMERPDPVSENFGRKKYGDFP